MAANVTLRLAMGLILRCPARLKPNFDSGERRLEQTVGFGPSGATDFPTLGGGIAPPTGGNVRIGFGRGGGRSLNFARYDKLF